MITLRNGDAVATIEPFGGQVMSYVPAGAEDLLWRTSDEHIAAARSGGKAPRGGVPVCWPWFGPHPADNAAPVHGLARIADWQVAETGADRAVLTFATDGTNPAFPHAAEARLEVRLGDALEVRLTTTNAGPDPFRITSGLHTYFRIGDVDAVEVLGLENVASNKGDRTDGAVTIAGEVDRIYAPVTDLLRIRDRALGRTIHVENGGVSEAVVWNPGSDKADMPEGSYRRMLCVEPANAQDAPTLQPGESHTISTRIWLSPLG